MKWQDKEMQNMSDFKNLSFDNEWGHINIAPAGGGSNGTRFMKLQNGENRIRIVSNLAAIATHYEKATDGSFKRIVCPGNGCPICAKGNRARVQYQCKAIDKSNWTAANGYDGDIGVKIVTLPAGVVRDINTTASDPEYGSPFNYDFKIIKTGEKLNTAYSTNPSPNKSALTEEEKEAVKACPSVEELTKIHSPEEIKAMNLQIFSDDVLSGESAQPKDESWDDFD